MSESTAQPQIKGNRKQIVLFLISQNISLFGSSVVGYAIMWHILLSTSSGVWQMMSVICSMVPQVLISMLGGVWADRRNRKHLIMLADGFIALSTLVLAIVYQMGIQHLELLLVVSVVRSIGAGIQTPAVGAIFPQIVPQENLTKVQGINQTLNSVLMLLSPAVGGALLGSVGIVPAFFIDVVTAALAIFVMGFIKAGRVERQTQKNTVWSDLKSGMRYTFRHRQLRRIVICYAIAFFLITPAAVLSPLMVERTFGDEVWRLTANEMIWTIGALVGGLFVSIKGQFKDKSRAVGISVLAFGMLFTLLGLSWNFSVFLIFMGAAGLFMPIVSTVQTVQIQEVTDPQMLGRVFSIIQLIGAGAMPVAILFFGPLADMVAVEWIIIISGIILAATGLGYYAINRASPIPVVTVKQSVQVRGE